MGVDPNISTEDGKTNLMFASEERKVWAVKILLENGASASINHANSDGNTALIFAASSSEGFTSDSLDCIKMLRDAGGDNNLANKVGMTPLMYTARNDIEDSFKFLLDLSVNIDLTGDDGFKLSQIAAEAGSLYILKMLIDFGVKIKITSKDSPNLLITSFCFGGD